jgi:hypothetical protein
MVYRRFEEKRMMAKARGIILVVALLLGAVLPASCDDAPPERLSGADAEVVLRPGGPDVTPAATGQKGAPIFVTIGTGGISGVYYPTGGAIANMVNLRRDKYHIRATVEATGGSVFNINAVTAGDLQFGIAQADQLYEAVHGLAQWREHGPQAKLRTVFSLHQETVTLVAGEDTGIRDILDLKGKRVNIGNPGSGQHQNSLDALKAAGLGLADIKAVEVKAVEAFRMLEAGGLDAVFYTVGHPSAAVMNICNGKRRVRMVPIAGVDALFEQPYYLRSRIDLRDYPGAANTDEYVESFGDKAMLFTSSDVPDEVVHAVAREVFENFDIFKGQQPAFAGLTKKGMLRGWTAPVHPGAATYYREMGLQ